MDRSAIDYLLFLEKNDSFFYKNFKDFIVFASEVNKNLQDEEYIDLKNAKDNDYKVLLKDKRTSINIVKNFFYKVSPSIIKQIDYDVANENILFLPKNQFKDIKSRINVLDKSYKIEISESNKIEESFLLVREYTHLFVGNILEFTDIEEGLKKIYLESITSLCEFALAKHLSFNMTLAADSRMYIFKKIYDSIYKMNDSYLTLSYLGYLLEGKTHEDIVKYLGDEKIVNYLNKIVIEKKPCNDYINTLSVVMALKLTNNTDNIYNLLNKFYIKAAEKDVEYLKTNLIVNLDQKEAVNEITHYIRNNK